MELNVKRELYNLSLAYHSTVEIWSTFLSQETFMKVKSSAYVLNYKSLRNNGIKYIMRLSTSTTLVSSRRISTCL